LDKCLLPSLSAHAEPSHLHEEGYVFANTGAPRRVGKFRAGLAPRSGASSGCWGNPASDPGGLPL
jgi:hypothetical protein